MWLDELNENILNIANIDWLLCTRISLSILFKRKQFNVVAK